MKEDEHNAGCWPCTLRNYGEKKAAGDQAFNGWPKMYQLPKANTIV